MAEGLADDGVNQLGSAQQETPKPFLASKILTVSLESFLKATDRFFSGGFDLIGVHDDGIFPNGDAAMAAFAKKVPEGALAVTDYRRAASSQSYVGAERYYIQSGTAIVPKAKA